MRPKCVSGGLQSTAYWSVSNIENYRDYNTAATDRMKIQSKVNTIFILLYHLCGLRSKTKHNLQLLYHTVDIPINFVLFRVHL